MGRKLDPAGPRAAQRRETEQRVLEAAAGLFVSLGYGRATIRGIAEAADVDPALVIHYFGSKEELFSRVTRAGPALSLSGSAEQMTEQILDNLAASVVNVPVRSLAMLRSMLTHPEAAQATRSGGRRYEEQLKRAIASPDADVRAALIVALLLGLVLSRHLLKNEALSAAKPAALVALLRPCLHELTGAKGPRVKRRTRVS
jgi:AcrR family transcriptional regulator